MNVVGITQTGEGFDAEREWARGLWSALEPYHQNVYVNFLMEEGEERVRQAYGREKYDRLKRLKRKYDPENFFRLNQNVSPTRPGQPQILVRRLLQPGQGTDDRRACPRRLGIAGRTYGIWPASLGRFADLVKLSIRIFDEPSGEGDRAARGQATATRLASCDMPSSDVGPRVPHRPG